METASDVIDDRQDRASALDRFARADEGRAKGEITIPPQAFSAGNDRIIGAQAVAVYRDEGRVLSKLKSLAAAAGTDWYYRFPVKNRKNDTTDWIEGPSIKLANDLARLYGNCDVDVRVMDLGDSWLFYARFTDFETGFSLTRPFQQRKNASKIGGADDGRRLDIALQIGASKSIRNVVVNALQTFSDFAFEEARNALVDKIGGDVEKWRQRVLARIVELGVDPTRVDRVIGRKAADWLAPDIAKIIAMMKAVVDGMASLDETFPPLEAAQGHEQSSAAEPKAAGGEKAGSLDEFATGEQSRQSSAATPTSGHQEPAEVTGRNQPAPGETDPASSSSSREESGTVPNPSEQDPMVTARDRGRDAYRRGIARRSVPSEYASSKAPNLNEAYLQGYDEEKAAARPSQGDQAGA